MYRMSSMYGVSKPVRSVAAGGRIQALDALRGFALCGIIFINIPQTMNMTVEPAGLTLFVHGRFYPIFYLLFGLGFGIFLRSAARRTDRPRVLLLRRLGALAVFGALHHLLQPGEVLLPFAVTGVLVLLPFSFAPARVTLPASAVLTVAGLLAGVGGLALLPGLFLLGFALTQLEVPETLQDRARQLVVLALASAVLAGSAYLLVVSGAADGAVERRVGLLCSLSMAIGYLAVFLLLSLRGGPLTSLLAPLGRMALTNYLTATVLFVPIGAALGLRGSQDWGGAAVLGAAILLVQLVASRWWLRAFRYGPAEWVWRCATYWRWLPLRRA